MSTRIICPILTNSKAYLEDCLQDECAWWDQQKESCAILSIAKALISIDGYGISITGREQ